MISLPNPLKCLQKKLISRLNMQNLILVYANNVQHYAKLRQIQKKITLIKSFDLVWWILYTGSESFLTNYTRFSKMNLNRKRVSKYFKHSSAKLYYKTTKYWQLKCFYCTANLNHRWVFYYKDDRFARIKRIRKAINRNAAIRTKSSPRSKWKLSCKTRVTCIQ